MLVAWAQPPGDLIAEVAAWFCLLETHVANGADRREVTVAAGPSLLPAHWRVHKASSKARAEAASLTSLAPRAAVIPQETGAEPPGARAPDEREPGRLDSTADILADWLIEENEEQFDKEKCNRLRARN